MDPKSRLMEYAKFKGLNNNQFTNKTGLGNGYFTIKGSVSSESLSKVSEVFRDLNLEWVITGKGYMLNRNKTSADFSYPVLQEERILTKLEKLKKEYPDAAHIFDLFEEYIHSNTQTMEMLIENSKGKDLVIENQADKIKLLEEKLLQYEIQTSKKK